MSYVAAILVAAGKGSRFKSRIPKLFARINRKPVIIYPLDVLGRHKAVNEIIVVANRGNKEEIARQVKRYRIPKVTKIIEGGRRRQDSVYNGVKATDSRAGLILVQDAARPFINEKMISNSLAAAGNKAAVVGVPVKPTIKEVSSPQFPPLRNRRAGTALGGAFVKKTLDRKKLWEAQTPQVFSRGLFLKAYARFGNSDVTDDASLVEKLGVKVKMVPGSYSNIKITTLEDLAIAKAIAKYA